MKALKALKRKKRKYTRRATLLPALPDGQALSVEREHLHCLEALLTIIGVLRPLSVRQRMQVLEVVNRGLESLA